MIIIAVAVAVVDYLLSTFIWTLICLKKYFFFCLMPSAAYVRNSTHTLYMCRIQSIIVLNAGTNNMIIFVQLKFNKLERSDSTTMDWQQLKHLWKTVCVRNKQRYWATTRTFRKYELCSGTVYGSCAYLKVVENNNNISQWKSRLYVSLWWFYIQST